MLPCCCLLFLFYLNPTFRPPRVPQVVIVLSRRDRFRERLGPIYRGWSARGTCNLDYILKSNKQAKAHRLNSMFYYMFYLFNYFFQFSKPCGRG